jgi:CheY-like chemotaxis protein
VEHSTLAGYSIFLVEPNPYLASDLGRALEGAGARTLIALNSIDALSLVKSPELLAAVLDLAQSTNDRHRFATRLKMLTVPFVFSKPSNVTGVGRTQPC